ncbi:MAG: hypothetical protein ACETVN_04300 [Asgard group archaeon]
MSNGSWDGGPITVIVDGLSVGTYVYKCTVYDTSGNSASDTVPVMVTEKEEEGFPWGTLSLTLGVIGITAVLIAVLAKYKR